MVKLADAPDLGSGAERHSGSSPLGGTSAPLPKGNGALVPSRSRSTDTPEGVPYFGCARAPPAASGGWASDFVLARRYHVGTRRPLQRDEQSSSLPLLRRSSRAVDSVLGHGIARTMGNSEVRAYAETPPGLSAEHTPSPFFPKNLRCANLFWEPYSFTYKANLVSPWAFARGLYSIGRMIPLRAYKKNLRCHNLYSFRVKKSDGDDFRFLKKAEQGE